MAAQGNPQVTYIQSESLYAYCNVCGRKSYNVPSTNVVAGVSTTASVICNAFNSSPSKYPPKVAPYFGYCQGTMTLQTGETNALFNSGGNLVNDERSFS